MNTMSTITSMRRVMQTAILGTLALTYGTLSVAADRSAENQVVVKFGDLNLSNPQGATVLYSRIVAAAEEVCNPLHYDTSDLETRARLDSCVHKAVMNGVTKVGQPELFAVYGAKNHEPISIIASADQTR